MRFIVVGIMVALLSGCGSIISRTMPGQGHGNQYYPGCNGTFVILHGAMSRSSICRFLWLLILYCYRLIFITAYTNN